MTIAYDAHALSLTTAANLRTAGPARHVAKAEAALAAIKADPAHTYAQESDARLAMADARLALFKAEKGVYAKPTHEQRCAMFK